MQRTLSSIALRLFISVALIFGGSGVALIAGTMAHCKFDACSSPPDKMIDYECSGGSWGEYACCSDTGCERSPSAECHSDGYECTYFDSCANTFYDDYNRCP
jgi:hypothetical protein